MARFRIGFFGNDFFTTAASSFFPKTATIQAAKKGFFVSRKDGELEERLASEADGESMLGTKVYGEVIIESGSFFEQEDTAQENPIPYEGLKIQSVLTEVRQDKNIITTELQGRDGSVKEYISRKDFNITMTGIIQGENTGDLINDVVGSNIQDIGNFYPFVDVTRLANILAVPDSIVITSDFLQIYGISDVVVVSFSTPQVRGVHDGQVFQINMLSDTAIELNELEI